jgi:hypothetical protein
MQNSRVPGGARAFGWLPASARGGASRGRRTSCDSKKTAKRTQSHRRNPGESECRRCETNPADWWSKGVRSVQARRDSPKKLRNEPNHSAGIRGESEVPAVRTNPGEAVEVVVRSVQARRDSPKKLRNEPNHSAGNPGESEVSGGANEAGRLVGQGCQIGTGGRRADESPIPRARCAADLGAPIGVTMAVISDVIGRGS